MIDAQVGSSLEPQSAHFVFPSTAWSVANVCWSPVSSAFVQVCVIVIAHDSTIKLYSIGVYIYIYIYAHVRMSSMKVECDLKREDTDW